MINMVQLLKKFRKMLLSKFNDMSRMTMMTTMKCYFSNVKFAVQPALQRLQPRYNTLLYSAHLLITPYRHGFHCLYFLCIRPSL